MQLVSGLNPATCQATLRTTYVTRQLIMATEIERKFLVRGTAWRTSDGVRIVQGYLARGPRCTIRVRAAGPQAWLAIKGAAQGITRQEFEYPIPIDEAAALLALCPDPVIEKIRHIILYEGAKWEVDEFLGANQGLVVAEIELEAENQPFPRPAWIDREVTDDPRYYNANLVRHPFNTWRDDETNTSKEAES